MVESRAFERFHKPSWTCVEVLNKRQHTGNGPTLLRGNKRASSKPMNRLARFGAIQPRCAAVAQDKHKKRTRAAERVRVNAMNRFGVQETTITISLVGLLSTGGTADFYDASR
ncbi:MAG: hypothetical protein ABI605_04745 [Rhizobacter sp.]